MIAAGGMSAARTGISFQHISEPKSGEEKRDAEAHARDHRDAWRGQDERWKRAVLERLVDSLEVVVQLDVLRVRSRLRRKTLIHFAFEISKAHHYFTLLSFNMRDVINFAGGDMPSAGLDLALERSEKLALLAVFHVARRS